ncbi:CDGSH iron-sulfur domain-containing protein [Methanothrix sp.]|uniref:CDGSH iron-sulfur domain-containing protein n=1 Tax=Methanothrix sp. TaxID=90426 RepID=UPI00329A7508
MTEQTNSQSKTGDDSAKITVSENGPYIVTGRVPLTISEICNDDDGYSRTWREVKRYPVNEKYALCRCRQSNNKPFCDGTHIKIHFEGTEAGDREPFDKGAGVIRGPSLILADNEHLCVHARFCMRAGGIWNLVKQSDDPEARKTAIEEACNCPSGRLLIRDNESGKAIEPEFEKSIVVIEYPAKGEHGPLWVRGGIPIQSADGKPYEIRNRVTVCRCGRSENKPFCDGSHIRE